MNSLSSAEIALTFDPSLCPLVQEPSRRFLRYRVAPDPLGAKDYENIWSSNTCDHCAARNGPENIAQLFVLQGLLEPHPDNQGRGAGNRSGPAITFGPFAQFLSK